MKKISALVLVFMLLCPMMLTAQNDSDSAVPAAAVPAGGKVPVTAKAPAAPQKATRFSSENLVDLGADRNTSRLDDLERRLSSLERGQRSQDDSMRQMSRDIDDLKRGVQDFRSSYR